MSYRRLIATCVCAVVAAALGCQASGSNGPPKGQAVETWETSNKTFKVRVTTRTEKAQVGLPGTFYIFQSAPAGSDDWREVMMFRHDDDPEIPRDQVRFVNDQVGYLFMGWMYAVTTDGGRTWSVWDAARELPQWRTNYRLIKDVSLQADGSGTMSLNELDPQPGHAELVTADYGRHWKRGS